MESHNAEVEVEVGMGGPSGSTPASSRWNPTKEQISMLENLYKQGIRTPSAEQIQQITARLRAYGHIEGKNVFYWFQNHKARQRQKQKQTQESMAYFNRFLHRSQSIFSSPICPNGVCAPSCLPQSEIGFYPPQHPKVLLPGGIVSGPRTEKVVPATEVARINCDGPQIQSLISSSNQETLALFPLHPTGILEGKKPREQVSSMATISAAESTTDPPSVSPDIDEKDGRIVNQPFFDFLNSAVPCTRE